MTNINLFLNDGGPRPLTFNPILMVGMMFLMPQKILSTNPMPYEFLLGE